MIEPIYTWVAALIEREHPEAPVLEIGAVNINGSVRGLFPEPYLGLDLQPGSGVDVVADILDWKSDSRFNTIICLETLEHITEPWKAIERVHGLLAAGGLFLASWPFMFEVHDYPSDYWRATPAGLQYLLERVGFESIQVDRLDTHVVAMARKAPRKVWRNGGDMKLDLGCGTKREEGFLATDIVGSPDVFCDARKMPFADESFEEVRCWHVLEHIERRDLITVMNECHRVLKPGGVIDIEMPVFPFWSAMADPTHVTFLVPQTWDYFSDEKQYGGYMMLYDIRPWTLRARRRLSDGQIMRVVMEKPEEAKS